MILSDIERSIKEKIEKYGIPLKDWDISIYRGILTGCNEAFIIDENKKEELIRKDAKSAEIIRPILRGRDIYKNGYDFKGLYVILASFGSHKYLQKDYPVIYEHLKQFENLLKNRGQCRYKANGKPDLSPDAPYPGQHHWLELDNNPRPHYLDDFNKPKIIYQELSQGSRFAFDPNGRFFVSNTAYLLTGELLGYLLKVLNSKIIEFAFRNYYSTSMGETGLRWLNQYVVNLPIPKPSPDISEAIQQASEAESEQIVGKLYNLSDSEMQFISSSVNL